MVTQRARERAGERAQLRAREHALLETIERASRLIDRDAATIRRLQEELRKVQQLLIP